MALVLSLFLLVPLKVPLVIDINSKLIDNSHYNIFSYL